MTDMIFSSKELQAMIDSLRATISVMDAEIHERLCKREVCGELLTRFVGEIEARQIEDREIECEMAERAKRERAEVREKMIRDEYDRLYNRGISNVKSQPKDATGW